jgi:hypothetical protein
VSDEPGVNLGRLIATERNALTALATNQRQEKIISELLTRVSRLEAEIVEMKLELQQVRSLIAMKAGGGPTAGN